MLEIFPIPAFTDNYIWAINDGHKCVVVDPGDAAPVIDYLAANKLTLSSILVTHHHLDHTGGVLALKEANSSVCVYGPHNPKIKGIDVALKEKETISLLDGQLRLSVLEVPGHTLDHIAYYNDNLLFCGDTLFSAGCGRMFEGHAEQFWQSLSKLYLLPDNVKVYCTHEYTLANLAFARDIDPQNQALADYEDWAKVQRQQLVATLPSDIKTERQINPFLRVKNSEFRHKMANKFELDSRSEVAVFAALRRAKDKF